MNECEHDYQKQYDPVEMKTVWECAKCAKRDSIEGLSLINDVNRRKKQDRYQYYNKLYKDIKLDPYRVLAIYEITNPAQQHAIKKLLRAGDSVKDLTQDVKEVIDTLNRMLEMIEEDEK